MARKAAFPVLPVILIAFCASHAFAAGVMITGRVVDENGSPVAGTRISVSASHQAPAPSVVSSDAAGLFRVEIPVKGVYRVNAEHQGFFLFHMQEMNLAPDSPVEIRLNHVKELAESVDVRYSPPAVDPEQTSESKRLDAPDLLNIPRPASQDFRNALPMMPGVVRGNDGQIHFNGGNTNETNYRLDGFDLSDPATGSLTADLNIDTIQTLEWNASRISPEKGRGSAGTLDIRTEMGDNHWRFSAVNLIPGLATQGGLYLNHWSPRAIFSGPIKKDRAWFHNASNLYYVASTIRGLPDGQNRTTSITGSNLSRFQWNVRDNHILTGSFLLNLGDSNHNGLSFLNPIETTVNRRQSLLLGNIKEQFLWGSGLLEIGFADTSAYFRASPEGTAPYVITPFGASGNFLRDERRHSGRQEWIVNGFFKPVEWKGTHQIQVGANVERSNLDEFTLRHNLSVVRVDNSLVRDVEFIGNPRQLRTSVATYGYAMDKWNPTPEVTVELGLRYQWDQYTKGAPPAPTLNAAWAPKRLGGTKFSTGWGLYFDSIPLRILALSQEQASLSTFFSPTGAPVGLPIETRYLFDPSDVRMPRYAIASFSAERNLPGNIYGRLSLTSRQGSRGPTFAETAASPGYNNYVLQNVERQRYRAAEVSFRRTFLARYQWFASYTRSEARSTAVIAYSIENPLLAPQAGGPVGWDTPNRAMTWGWLPIEKTWFPHFLQPLASDTDFQLLGEYRSGFPFSVTTETGHLIGRPNDLRFPDYCSLNIALERKFPFRGYVWAFRAGLVNALNRQNSDVVNNDFDSPQFMQFGGGQGRAVNFRLRLIGRK